MRPLVGILLALPLAVSPVLAGEKPPVKPSPKDKCPVCGMFVAKYPDFLAQVIFKDGSYSVFDGAKDMFKYYLNLEHYNPGKKVEDIDSMYVTDYYSLTPIDGFAAHYVLGSQVYGPMGKELIPFQKEDDAQEFMADHIGQEILKFHAISLGTMKRLE